MTRALVTLIVQLPEAYQALAENFARFIKAADLPRGWLPEGPDDPILVALFERARSQAPA